MNREIIKSYLLSEEKEVLLWEKAIFVFDSSALLDIYFLPKPAREKIYIEIFQKLPQRLWMPFHVQFEYLKNREKIIGKPILEKYEPIKQKVRKFESVVKSDILKRIDEVCRETHKDDKHPYIDQNEINVFKKNIEGFISQIKIFEEGLLKRIDEAEKEILNVRKDDDLLKSLESSFEVGREFTFDEIIEITKEGKHRYEFKIPPGYGDLYKNEKKGTQIFGDLIIWKQILEFSKEKKLPIIFVTNDIKKDEDWCYLDPIATEDRILSPREELIKEMKDFSKVDFWMYNLPQFFYNANKYLQSDIKEETIQNISQFLNTKNKKSKYLRFKCDECGLVHKYSELDIDLEFECIGGSERNMGTENQYQANQFFECECGNKISATFEVWEYPIGVHNYDSVNMEGADLLDIFYFTVDFFGDSNDDDGFYICHICDGNSDNMGNYVDFLDRIDIENEYDESSPMHKYKYIFGGKCQWCNTLHIRCPKCKSITMLSETDKNIECEGGCGLIFSLDSSNDSDGIGEYRIKLIDHRKEKCTSCGEDFVDLRNIGVCEKCDLKLNLE